MFQDSEASRYPSIEVWFSATAKGHQIFRARRENTEEVYIR